MWEREAKCQQDTEFEQKRAIKAETWKIPAIFHLVQQGPTL